MRCRCGGSITTIKLWQKPGKGTYRYYACYEKCKRDSLKSAIPGKAKPKCDFEIVPAEVVENQVLKMVIHELANPPKRIRELMAELKKELVKDEEKRLQSVNVRFGKLQAQLSN